MNRVGARLAKLRGQGGKAFIPFIMAGYPGLEETAALIRGLAAAGADVIEIGLPFSDPLADGEVNQTAAQAALAAGFTIDRLLALLKDVSGEVSCPLMLFTYCNPLLQRGVEPFLADLASAGLAGLLVPDLPPEAAGEVRTQATCLDLGLAFFSAPTSTPARIALAAEASTAFLYAVSLRGVTGERRDLPPDLPDFVSRIRQAAACPIMIGFGISRPEQAAAAAALADGVIVGSALVRLAGQQGVEAACRLAGEMRGAIDGQDGRAAQIR